MSTSAIVDSGLKASPKALMQMLFGGWIARCLYTFCKLGFSEPLQRGPQSSTALAELLQLNPRGVYRLLRTLAGLGIVEAHPNETFSLAPLGELLREDHPHSVRPMALLLGEEHYQAWGDLAYSIQTNHSAFEYQQGRTFFEYLADHPESDDIFNQAMTAFSKQSHLAATAYDFSQFKTLVDVAGGHGYLLGAILKAHPTLQGILFDLPHVVAGASATFEGLQVGDRTQIVGGSFFESVPAADAYILSHIIHDWDDAHAVKILQNIHQAMATNGKLLLLEHVVGTSNTSPFALLMDLNMLVMTHGGAERTETEFKQLFEQAGFELTQLILVPGLERYLIEGVKR